MLNANSNGSLSLVPSSLGNDNLFAVGMNSNNNMNINNNNINNNQGPLLPPANLTVLPPIPPFNPVQTTSFNPF